MNDGGPAFPVMPYGREGMSLRDWFAGQALTVMLASNMEPKVDGNDYTPSERLAKQSYMIADAMLAERSKCQSS